MTMEYREGLDRGWQQSLEKDGWRFPTKEEVELIWSNRDLINKTIIMKSGERNRYWTTLGLTERYIHFYADNGVAYDYKGYLGEPGFTRLVKDF